MPLHLLRYFLPRCRQGNQFLFFCSLGAVWSWIRYSQRQAQSLIHCLDGVPAVPVPAELLLHKPYSLVARTRCSDSHKSLWRRSLPNTCQVGWFNYPRCRVGFPGVLLMAHVQGHTKRMGLLGWETDVGLCLFSQPFPATHPHTSCELQKIPPWAPSKGVFNVCVQLPGAKGTVTPWQGVMASLGESLFLCKHWGQGQFQHDALEGMIVLKAGICLATNPTH